MKKSKKILSLLLAVILLFGVSAGFGIQSFAEDDSYRSIIDEKSDSEYVIGSEKGLTVCCRYYICGFNIADLSAERIMKPSKLDYIMNQDCTVLTLKPSYLDTLKAGKYSVSVFYDTEDDGYINQHEFNIVEPATEKTTKASAETLTKPTTQRIAESAAKAAASDTTVKNTDIPSTKSPLTGNEYLLAFSFMAVIVSGLGTAVCFIFLKKKCQK